jgi:predicted porin
MYYKAIIITCIALLVISNTSSGVIAQSNSGVNVLIKAEYINPIYITSTHTNNFAHANWIGYRITPTIQIGKVFEGGLYVSTAGADVIERTYVFDSRSTLNNYGILLTASLNISPKLILKPSFGFGGHFISNQARTSGIHYSTSLNLTYAFHKNYQVFTSIGYQYEKYDIEGSPTILNAFESAHVLIPTIGMLLRTNINSENE